jgi:hypothetical protein
MSSYEKLIGQALLGGDREQSMRRIACKTVASTQMVCGCGDVLDQRTVCVLETQDGSKTLAACCPACKEKQAPEIAAIAADKNWSLVWLTWNGAETVNDESIVRSITIVGRRWFQQSYGNTYFSVVVFVNGDRVHSVDCEYGYGSQYEQCATDWLLANGYLPDDSAPLSKFCRENKIELLNTVVDVPRKKDLV